MWNAWGLLGEWVGNVFGSINEKLLRIIWETVGIHTETLESLWGLLVGNPFVGKGTNANRTHPHACDIPYKTALPVLCTHRFFDWFWDGFWIDFEAPDPPKWSSRLHEALIFRKSQFSSHNRFWMSFGRKVSPRRAHNLYKNQ